MAARARGAAARQAPPPALNHRPAPLLYTERSRGLYDPHFAAWGRSTEARTTDAFWKDISVLLSGDFSPGTRRIVVNGAVWCFTEGPGRKHKYVGCRFWSRGAIDDVNARGFEGLSKRLRHEHVVPRKLVIEEILGLAAPTPEDVQRAFERYAIGCVVTVDEMRRLDRGHRKSMPPDWRTPGPGGLPDVWARYTVAGVERVGPLRWEGRTAWRLGEEHPVIPGR